MKKTLLSIILLATFSMGDPSTVIAKEQIILTQEKLEKYVNNLGGASAEEKELLKKILKKQKLILMKNLFNHSYL